MRASLRLLFLALVCCFAPFASEARADSLALDPLGDTFGSGTVQHDITSINAVFDATTLTFTVNFSGAIFAPSVNDARSVIGFIDIDADRNPATGVESATAFFGPSPAPNLGVEYGIDIGSEFDNPSFVEVFDAFTSSTIGVAPITFGVTSFSVAVPLSLIGGNGLVNYAGVFGTFLEPTDKVPNGTEPATSRPIPEPTTLLLLGTGLAGAGVAARRRRTG